MIAASPTLSPHELGRQVDPATTIFAPALERLAPGLDRGLAERMLRGLLESDRLADDVAREFSELRGGEGWRMLDQALTDGLDAVPGAPPALRAMLTPILDPPDWVNWELFNAGTVAFARPLLATHFAGALALGYGYRYERIAKILLSTGRIDEMAGKRLLETAQWATAATAPDNMRPDRPGSGIAACVRVRLVHAYVRRHMLEQDDWDLRRYGIPINATDSAATLNGAFFIQIVEGVEKLGIRYSPSERETLAHMWRWIGFVMGVEDDLLPTSYEWATQFTEIVEGFDERICPGGEVLTDALLRRGLPQILGVPAALVGSVGRATVPFTSALLGYLLGAESARGVGLRFTPLTAAMHVTPLAGRAYNLLRASGLLGDDPTIARRGQALTLWLLSTAGSPDSPVHPEAAVAESRAGQTAAA